MYRISALSRPWRRTALARCVVVGLAVLGAACSGDAAAGGCEPIRTEPLAADWLLHILPGGEASYVSNPPTSGPHTPWEAPALIGRALSPGEQVGVLETGDVLVQYRPTDVDPDRLEQIERTLPERAHLAPNPDLPSPVVFTAHLTKQECPRLDVEAIRLFARDHSREAVG